MGRVIIILLLGISVIKSFGQERYNQLGFREGFVKVSFYDEMLNFQTYNRTSFNPVHLRYFRHKGKNTFTGNFIFLKTNLKPKSVESLVRSDEISLFYANLDLSYLRQIISLDQFSMGLGARVLSNALTADRTFTKTFPFVNAINQSSYELTPFSIQLASQFEYDINEKTEVSLWISSPVLSYHLVNNNSTLSARDHEYWFYSLQGLAGINTELSITKNLGRLSAEVFQTLQYFNYKVPNNKKVLFNKIGLGLYYVF